MAKEPPFGDPQDSAALHHGAVRAELIEIIARHCLAHASKAADAILAEFDITPHRRLGRRRS